MRRADHLFRAVLLWNVCVCDLDQFCAIVPHTFLSTTLECGQWPTSCPGRFTPGRTETAVKVKVSRYRPEQALGNPVG